MVRTAKSHHSNHHLEEEEEDGDELAHGTIDSSSNRDGKNSEYKTNSSRSKHSETEQRRRSKINERFEILRDLIPPNDQRRDKASLLLEVIEYVQFLQEKVQMYEGSCQGWSQEPTKLTPWQRSNHGLGESYSEHSQVMKNGCAHDNNVVHPVANMQSTVQSDFGGNAYEGADHVSDPTTMAVNVSSLPTIYPGRSTLPVENLASQPELQVWRGESCLVECTTTANTISTQDKTHESSLSNISGAYSQGLLKSLTDAFQESGVDLSQANISVQLDIGKPSINHNLSASVPEYPGKGLSSDQPLMHYREDNVEDPHQAAKRFRSGEN